MVTKITAAATEIGWFLATMVGLNYFLKTWGAAKLLWWTAAISSLLCGWIALTSVVGKVHQYGSLTPRGLLVPALFSILAAINAMTCWAFWKRKPSATAWGIAACLTYVLLSLFTIWSRVHRSQSIRGSSGIMLAVGVIGLVALLRRDERHEPDS